MNFKVTTNTSSEERRSIRKAAATIGLIDEPLRNRSVEVKKSIRLLGDNSGFTLGNLDLAIEGFTVLKRELEKFSRMNTVEDWGFRYTPTPPPRPLRRGPGAPLANRVRTDPQPQIPLVDDPATFVEQMAELRKSQIPDVDHALSILRQIRKKMVAIVKIADTYGDDENEESEDDE